MSLSSLGLTEIPGIVGRVTDSSMFTMTGYVSDWSVVAVNWDEGTIAPPSEHATYEIEVWWTEVERRFGQTTDESRPASKDRGGRPPKYDWVPFYAEIIRIANDIDGLPERHVLVRQMMDWWSAQVDSPPSESVVRDRISAVYPRK